MDNNDGLQFSAEAPPTASYESPATAAPAPARRGITPAILAVVAIAGLAVGFGAGYAAHGGSGTAKPTAAAATSASSAAATVTVHGSLTLKLGHYLSQSGTLGEDCAALDGYNDISAGAAVTIGDQTGATVIVTQLEQGQVTADGCAFNFDTQAPARPSYTIAISHRGTQVFDASQIGQANMTLG